MKFVHKNTGTCSTQVNLNEGESSSPSVRGAATEYKGISRLAEGRNAREVAAIIKGINCGFKKTSCPDQLARAIEEALGETDSQQKQA
jgi:uncharacterized protein (TIGR03905 family)